MTDSPTLEEVEESAHDTMRAVMEEIAAKEEPVDEPEGEPEAATDSESQEKPPRDERGRFKSTAEIEEPAAASTVEAEEPTEEPETIDPPYDWSVEEQEVFRTMPDGAKKMVLERVNEARQATQWAVENSRRFTALDQVLAQQRDIWARDGLDEAGGIRQLIGLSNYAASDAPGFIRWFAEQRGLTPEQIWQAQQPDSGQYVDPEVLTLRRELDGFKNYIQTQQTNAAQMQEQQLRAELQTFEDAKDANGKPLHPYFNEVRALMGSFYGQVKDLGKAYDMACRANPGTFAKIEAAQRVEADRERAKQNREKAAAAKQAGSSVSGTPGEREATEPSGDIREDMRRQFAERGLL